MQYLYVTNQLLKRKDEELEGLREKVVMMEGEVARKDNRLSALVQAEQDLGETRQKQVLKMKEIINIRDEEIKSLKNKVELLEGDTEKRSALEKNYTVHQQYIIEVEAKIMAKDSDLANALHEDLHRMGDILSMKDRELNSLRNEVKLMKGNLREKDNILSKFAKSDEAHQEYVRELEAKITAQGTNRANVSCQDLCEIEVIINSKNEVLKGFKSTLDWIKEDIEIKNKMLSEFAISDEVQQMDINELKVKMTKRNRDLENTIHKNLDKVEDVLNSKDEELESLKRKVELMEADIQNKDIMLFELVKSDKAHQQCISELEAKLMVSDSELAHALHKDLHSMEDILNSKEEVLKHLQNTVELMKADAEHKDSMLSELAISDKAHQHCINELRAKITNRDHDFANTIYEDLRKMEDIFNIKDEELKSLKSTVELMKTDLERLILDSAKSYEEHQENINKLLARDNELRNALHEMEKVVETKDAELECLKDRVDFLKKYTEDKDNVILALVDCDEGHENSACEMKSRMLSRNSDPEHTRDQTLKDLVNNRREELQNLRDKVEWMDSEMKKRDYALSGLVSSLKERDNYVEELKIRILERDQDLQKAYDKIEDLIDTHQREKKELKQKCAETEKQMNEVSIYVETTM